MDLYKNLSNQEQSNSIQEQAKVIRDQDTSPVVKSLRNMTPEERKNLPDAAPSIDEVMQKRQSDIEAFSQKYNAGIDITPDQYNFFTQMLAKSDDVERDESKMAQALLYSRNYGFDPQYAMNNLDALNAARLGSNTYDIAGVKKLRNSFKVGDLTVDRGRLAEKYYWATMNGKDTSELDAQIQQLDAEIESLSEYAPKTWVGKLLGLSAQTIPYSWHVFTKAAAGGIIGSAIAPGVGTVMGIAGSFSEGYRLTKYSQYYDLVKAGIDPTVANWTSTLSGVVQAAIESIPALSVETRLGLAVTGGAKQLSQQVIERAIANGTMGKIALLASQYLINAAAEGGEEFLQQITEDLTDNIAYELSGMDVPNTPRDVIHNSVESYIGGAGAALVLGLVEVRTNNKQIMKYSEDLKQDAVKTDSKESFINKHVTDDQFNDVIGDVSESVKKETLSKIWETNHSAASQMTEAEAKTIAVDYDINEDFIPGDIDSEGKEVEAQPSERGEVVRMDNGRLRVQESERYTENSDGTESHTLNIGSKGSKTNFGYVDYTINEETRTVTIDQVATKVGYENLTRDAILEVERSHEGWNIEWNPETEAQNKVKEQLIKDSPNKTLQWFDNGTDVETTIKVGNWIRNNFKNLTKEQSVVAARLLEFTAQAQGVDTNTWINDHIQNLDNFNEAGKKGAVQFDDKDLKAIIYAGENADFSTFSHETFHTLIRTSQAASKLSSALKEAAETDQFKKYVNTHQQIIKMNSDEVLAAIKDMGDNPLEWTRAQHEVAATLFESYLRDGKTFSEKLKNIFAQIADWFRRIYKSMKFEGMLNDNIIKAYDEFLAGDSTLQQAQQNSKEQSIKKYTDTARYEASDIEGNVYIDPERKVLRDKNSFEKAKYEKELKMAHKLSDQYNCKVFVLPPDASEGSIYVEKNSNPDGIVNGFFIDFKQIETSNKNSVQRALKEGFRQADAVYIELGNNMSIEEAKGALIGQIVSSKNSHNGFGIILSDIQNNFEQMQIQKKRLETSLFINGAGLSPLSNNKYSKETDYVNRLNQTDITGTDNFKKWFGDSKVVNEDGSPKVVYHGSIKRFEAFNKSDKGIYFTDNKDAAESYGMYSEPYAVYLKAENPYILDFEGGVDAEETDTHLPLEDEVQKAFEAGYDSVIAYNTFDGENELDQYIVKGSTQIKSANNNGQFDPNNSNIYYQTDDSLYGIHNLSEANLRYAIKMGGLANPSVAVVDINKSDFTKYGDISLIPYNYMLSKSEGRNVGTFGADIYSPRYPSIKKFVTKEGSSTIKDIFSFIEDENLRNQLADKLEEDIEQDEINIEQLNRSVLPIAYLSENGISDFYVYKEEEFSKETKDKIKALGDKADAKDEATAKLLTNIFIEEKTKDLRAELAEYEKAYKSGDAADKKIFSELITETKDKLKAKELAISGQIDKDTGLLFFNRADSLLYYIRKEIREGRKLDLYDTKNKAQQLVKDDKNYESWAKEKLNSIAIDEKIFNGFTPSGNRRYIEHTLANVSKYMKAEGLRGGENFDYGLGSARAKVAPKFTTLKQIKDAKNRIVSSEEFETIKEQFNNEFEWIMDTLSGGEYDFGVGSARYQEAIEARDLNSNYFEREYGLSVSDADMERIAAFTEALKEMPTEYFETKFERPVGLGEFAAAIVPENTDSDLVDYLTNNGLIVRKYDNNNTRLAQTREAIFEINQKRKVLFQLDSATESSFLTEAKDFETKEEFIAFENSMAFGEAEFTEEELSDIWDKAHNIQKDTEGKKYVSPIDEFMSEDEKDNTFKAIMNTDEGIKNFIARGADAFGIRSDVNRHGGRIEVYSEEEYQEFMQAIQTADRIQTEAAPYITALMMRGQDISEDAIKKVRGMILNSVRDYRDLYSQIMGDENFAAGVYNEYLPNIKDSRSSGMRITQRKDLVKRLEGQEIIDAVKRGTEKYDGTAEKVIAVYEKEIADLNNKIQKLSEQSQSYYLKMTVEEKENFNKQQKIKKMESAITRERQNIRTKLDSGVRVSTEQLKRLNGWEDELNLLHEEVKQLRKQDRVNAALSKREALDNLKNELKQKQKDKAAVEAVHRYKRELYNNIMKKPSANVDYSYIEKIKALQATMQDVSGYQNKTIQINGKSMKLDEFRAAIEAGTIQIEGLSDYQLKRYLNTSLADLTIVDLETLNDTVAYYEKMGRQMWQAKVDKKNFDAERLRNQIYGQITSSEHYKPEDDNLAGSAASDKKLKEGLFTKGRIYKKTLNWARKAQMIDNGQKGLVYDLTVEERRLHQDEYLNGVRNRMNKVKDLMKQLGVAEEDFYQPVQIQFPDGKVEEFTAGKLAYAMLAEKNERNLYAVAFGNLVTQIEKENMRGTSNQVNKQIEKLGMARYKTLKAQAEYYFEQHPNLLKVVEEGIVADWNNPEVINRINQVLIEEYNQPMDVEGFYMTMHRQDFNGTESAYRLQDDMYNLNAGKSATTPAQGFKKSRIDISPEHQTPVDMDIYRVWADSVDDQENVIANVAYVRKLNRVFKNFGTRGVRSALVNAYGQAMEEDLNNYINEIANSSLFTDTQEINGIVNKLRGKLYPAYLGYKLSGIVLQGITSPMPFLQEVGPVELAKGLMQMSLHPVATWKKVCELSAYMENRSMNPAIDAIKKYASQYTDSKMKRAYDSFLEKGTWGLEAVDRWAVTSGWIACYEKKLAELGGETVENVKAAAHYADNVVRDTQPSGDVTELAPLFKSKNAFAQAFTQFQVSLNVIWNNVTYDLPQAMKKHEYRKAVGLVFGYTLAGILLQAVQNGFDDDDEPEDVAKKIIYGATTQFTQSFPLLGSLADSTMKTFITGENGWTVNTNQLYPGISLIGQGISTMMSKGLNKTAAKNLVKGASIMVGLPVSGASELRQVFLKDDIFTSIEEGDFDFTFNPGAVLGRRNY